MDQTREMNQFHVDRFDPLPMSSKKQGQIARIFRSRYFLSGNNPYILGNVVRKTNAEADSGEIFVRCLDAGTRKRSPGLNIRDPAATFPETTWNTENLRASLATLGCVRSHRSTLK